MLEQPISLVFLAFLIALLPFVLALSTAYLKINIVFSLLRNAIGAQQVPSGMIITALSLSLTCMVMQPVFEKSLQSLEVIDLDNLKEQKVSEIINQLLPVTDEWRKFLHKHAGSKELQDLQAMIESAEEEKSIKRKGVLGKDSPSIATLLTAFVLSELKEAFYMGFVVMLPFLLLDFIIANFLAALGMYMFSPVLIALPLKILMIVVLDFWSLIFQSLFYSYS